MIESYAQQDMTGTEEAQVPLLHVSASEGQDDIIRATLVNLSADKPQNVQGLLSGRGFSCAEVRYIAGNMNDCNAFNQEPGVDIKTMADIRITDNKFVIEIPACSVMEIVLI